ncbi:Crp/Fnr family transcriptional regulator [Alsobacter sp. R-9]
MGLEAEVESLRAVPIFKGLDPRRLKLIAFTSQRLSFKTGDVMFRQGSDSDCAYVIIEGSADVVLETASGPLVVSRIGARSLVGEMGVITGAPRSASVIAASDASVLRLPRDHFLSLLEEFSQLALAVMRDLAHRLEATNRLLVSRSESKPG